MDVFDAKRHFIFPRLAKHHDCEAISSYSMTLFEKTNSEDLISMGQ